MTILEMLVNTPYDVNANARIFVGQWNDGGKEVGIISCGNAKDCPDSVLNSNVTYVTVDDNGSLVIECDAKLPQELDIQKMLTVWTGHVTQETFESLSLASGIRGESELPVYEKTSADNGASYGLYIYLIEGQFEWDKIPEDLRAIAKLAWDNGCEVLCLDSDGPELEGYPVYEW